MSLLTATQPRPRTGCAPPAGAATPAPAQRCRWQLLQRRRRPPSASWRLRQRCRPPALPAPPSTPLRLHKGSTFFSQHLLACLHSVPGIRCGEHKSACRLQPMQAALRSVRCSCHKNFEQRSKNQQAFLCGQSRHLCARCGRRHPSRRWQNGRRQAPLQAPPPCRRGRGTPRPGWQRRRRTESCC